MFCNSKNPGMVYTFFHRLHFTLQWATGLIWNICFPSVDRCILLCSCAHSIVEEFDPLTGLKKVQLFEYCCNHKFSLQHSNSQQYTSIKSVIFYQVESRDFPTKPKFNSQW